MIIERSDVFSTNGALAASSCGANALPQPQFDFGFIAIGLQVLNSCGPRMFFNLSGGVATTANAYIACGQTLEVWPPNFMSCGLGLTSTSTSTAAGGSPTYSINAWASA